MQRNQYIRLSDFARTFPDSLISARITLRLIIVLCLVIDFNTWGQSWEWAKKAAKSANDLYGTENTGTSVAVDGAGNAFFTGIFRGTVQFASTTLTTGSSLFSGNAGFVAKYSNTGQFLWAIKLDAAGGTGIATDAQGNACVVGAANNQLWLSKYSSNGTLLWSKVSTGTGTAVGAGVAVDIEGNVFVTGFFSGSIELGGLRVVSSGSDDVFLAKLSNGGTALWLKNAGGGSDDEGTSVALDASSNCYVTGFFKGVAAFGNQSLTSQADQNGIPTSTPTK